MPLASMGTYLHVDTRVKIMNLKLKNHPPEHLPSVSLLTCVTAARTNSAGLSEPKPYRVSKISWPGSSREPLLPPP